MSKREFVLSRQWIYRRASIYTVIPSSLTCLTRDPSLLTSPSLHPIHARALIIAGIMEWADTRKECHRWESTRSNTQPATTANKNRHSTRRFSLCIYTYTLGYIYNHKIILHYMNIYIYIYVYNIHTNKPLCIIYRIFTCTTAYNKRFHSYSYVKYIYLYVKNSWCKNN